jgi:hypothetical protein
MRLANPKLQAIDAAKLAAAARKKLFGIVGLKPVAEELGRDGHLHYSPVVTFQFNSSKPACEYVVAKFRAEATLNTPPFMLNRGREIQRFHFKNPSPPQGLQRFIGKSFYSADKIPGLRCQSKTRRLLFRLVARSVTGIRQNRSQERPSGRLAS